VCPPPFPRPPSKTTRVNHPSFILFHLFHFVSFCFILFHFVSFCFSLFQFVSVCFSFLSYFVSFCFILFHFVSLQADDATSVFMSSRDWPDSIANMDGLFHPPPTSPLAGANLAFVKYCTSKALHLQIRKKEKWTLPRVLVPKVVRSLKPTHSPPLDYTPLDYTPLD
jgi:hypothetical protein